MYFSVEFPGSGVLDSQDLMRSGDLYYWHKVKHICPTKLIGTTARNYEKL